MNDEPEVYEIEVRCSMCGDDAVIVVAGGDITVECENEHCGYAQSLLPVEEEAAASN